MHRIHIFSLDFPLENTPSKNDFPLENTPSKTIFLLKYTPSKTRKARGTKKNIYLVHFYQEILTEEGKKNTAGTPQAFLFHPGQKPQVNREILGQQVLR